jgi:hypothetical protein
MPESTDDQLHTAIATAEEWKAKHDRVQECWQSDSATFLDIILKTEKERDAALAAPWNLHDLVTVKLTEEGQVVLQRWHLSLGVPFVDSPTCTMLLWELMAVFGKYMGHGTKSMFEGGEIRRARK